VKLLSKAVAAALALPLGDEGEDGDPGLSIFDKITSNGPERKPKIIKEYLIYIQYKKLFFTCHPSIRVCKQFNPRRILNGTWTFCSVSRKKGKLSSLKGALRVRHHR
jgi:hypothetical protein